MQWRPDTTVRTADGSRLTTARDAEHAVRIARTPREQIAAINALNRLKTIRDGDPLGAAALSRVAPPTSVGDINAYNRAFWAGRS